MSFAPPPIREPVGTRVWLDWFRESYRRTEPFSPGNDGKLSIDDLTVTDLTVTDDATITDLTVTGDSTFADVTVNEDIALSGILTGGQSSVSANTVLTDNTRSVLVTASGKTITLPAASTARIGGTWTIILGVVGYVDITRSGSDTINLPTNDTTIRMANKGASVSLRCLTATSWGLV